MSSLYYNLERDYSNERKAQRISLLITLLLGIVILVISYYYKQQVHKLTEPELITLDFAVETEEKTPPLDMPKEVEKIVPSAHKTINSGGSSGQPARASNKETTAKGKENSSPNSKPVIVKSGLTENNKEKISAKKNTAPINKGKEEQKAKDDKAKKALENMKKGKNTSGGAGNNNSNNRSGTGGTGIRDGNGSGNGTGNGTGSGNKIGENGRNLVSFIPGTEGKGGKLPTHNCSATGIVRYSYKVNKSGQVTSVQRISGSTNSCLVNKGIEWIKKYVKANTGSGNAEGVYKIEF